MIRYAEDKPKSCEYCYFWNEKKKECRQMRCFYQLPEKPPDPDPLHRYWVPCKGCPYGKSPCIGYCMAKILKEQREKSNEDFWTKAERLLYCALIGYIWYEAPEEEQNFSTLLEFINASETREEDEEFKNAVDELFEELERDNPNHFAVRQYKKYKLAAGKTAKSILISCGARLAPFDIAELRELMSYDEMELDMIGDQRTALFIIISDTDDTFNFVVAMMYSQLFNLLCDRADDVHHGRLPYHVRILCDEFANSVTRSTPKTVGITDKSVKKQATDYLRTARMERHLTGSCR